MRSRFLPPAVADERPAPSADQRAATDALTHAMAGQGPAGTKPPARTPNYSRYVLGQGMPSAGRVELGAAIDDLGPQAAQSAANSPSPADEVAALRAQAQAQGHAEGLEVGRAAAKAEVAGLVDLYKRSIEKLAGLEQQIVDTYREQLGELALAIAQAVTRGAVEDGSAVVALAREAMTALGTPEALELRVAPADAAHLSSWAETRRAAGVDIAVRVDEALEPGDLQARCAGGELETRIQARIDRAMELVRAVPKT